MHIHRISRFALTVSALLVSCLAPCALAETPRTITLEELARSLPKEPINVVFDVDDTVLFTSPGFQWGSRTYGPQIVSAGVSVREEDLPSDEDRRKYREFWTKMNNELDQYSVKKWIASELIALHKSRGDRIYFVTKRIYTGSEADRSAAQRIRLARRLSGRDLHQPPAEDQGVQGHQGAGELRRLRWRHSRFDPGRSAAHPRPALPASVNHEPTHNGGFGEEVLYNSEND